MTFKKYEGIQKLTRDIVIEVIENILVRENGDIEVRLKCRDVLNSATELFEKSISEIKDKNQSA